MVWRSVGLTYISENRSHLLFLLQAVLLVLYRSYSFQELILDWYRPESQSVMGERSCSVDVNIRLSVSFSCRTTYHTAWRNIHPHVIPDILWLGKWPSFSPRSPANLENMSRPLIWVIRTTYQLLLSIRQSGQELYFFLEIWENTQERYLTETIKKITLLHKQNV